MATEHCSFCSSVPTENIYRCCTVRSKHIIYCSQNCQYQDWFRHYLSCAHNKPQVEEQHRIAPTCSKTPLPKHYFSSDEEDPYDKIKNHYKKSNTAGNKELNTPTEKNIASFPIEEVDEENVIKEIEKEQKELIIEEEKQDIPIIWNKVKADDMRLQIAIMSKKDGMKHIKLRYIFREEKEKFLPIDFTKEHIDSTFEASVDVLENYDRFLLVSRRNDSINNFASITFEADFSMIFFRINEIKTERSHAIEKEDLTLEMELNEKILSLIRQKEVIESAYNQAKLEVVRRGIVIIQSNSDGIYNFVGSSPSRNEACFFYNGTQEKIFKMVHELGDFSLIPDTEKRAKRIGLLFTSIKVGFEVEKSQWEIIDDIEHDNYNFTDGCGFISPDLIALACRKYSETHRPIEKMPCVVQTRFLGFKGILLLKPELKNKIQFRKSMLKFKVKTEEKEKSFFGVIAHSTPFSITYLSLQSIMLLSALGVKDSTFFKLQNGHFNSLDKILTNPKVAYHFCRLKDRTLMKMMERHGFTKVVINALRALRRKELEGSVKKIRRTAGDVREVERLRILVPKSRLVYGVCDPYGQLNYGECYFCPTMESGYSKIFKKVQVVVFRNPCYHMGDIRKLTCVDFSDRRYEMYKDVIIFPTTGSRPHCNEMSSGDLDGDMYSVIWDEDFVHNITTVEPFSLSIPGNDMTTKNRRTTSSIKELYERQKWFAMHSSNNSLGKINSAFLKYANRYGPGHPECVKIGAMFNMSLDSGMFDEVNLREVSRRVNSSAWERLSGYENNVWSLLIRNNRRRRNDLNVDCGIIVYVRKEDDLAVAQCRKRETIFVDSKWKNGTLKVGDFIKFRVCWNRKQQLLMAENVILVRDSHPDLVQELDIPRLCGVITRIKELRKINIPLQLPKHLHPSTLEGYIFFEHVYMKKIIQEASGASLKARKPNGTIQEPLASYIKFDNKGIAQPWTEGSLKVGDQVSFSFCYGTDGTPTAHNIRLLPNRINDKEVHELSNEAGTIESNGCDYEEVILEPLVQEKES